MKWVLISAGVALFIVALTIVAMNKKDVEWNGAQPHCPHCRVLVAPYAEVCATCKKGFDWVADERPCPLGLQEIEVRFLKAISEADVRAKVAAAGGKVDGLDADGVVLWINELDPKKETCVFCAGTGEAMGLDEGSPLAKLAAELDGDCPVCVGEDDCIGCGGDGEAEYGDPDARERLELYVEIRDSGRPLIGKLPASEIAGRFRRTLDDLAGTAEIEQLWFPHGTQNVFDVAEIRRDAILDLFRTTE